MGDVSDFTEDFAFTALDESTLSRAKSIVCSFELFIIRRATRGGGGRLPLPFFENKKKCRDFRKKGPDCVHPYVKFTIQNVVLRVSKRKNFNIFPCLFFWNFWQNVYQSALISRNLPCPKKFLVAPLIINAAFSSTWLCVGLGFMKTFVIFLKSSFVTKQFNIVRFLIS